MPITVPNRGGMGMKPPLSIIVGGSMAAPKTKTARKEERADLRQINVPEEWHAVLSYIADREKKKIWQVAAEAFAASNLRDRMRKLAPPELPK